MLSETARALVYCRNILEPNAIIHRRFTRIALNQSDAPASLVIVRLATLEANLNHIRLEPKVQFTNIPKIQKIQSDTNG